MKCSECGYERPDFVLGASSIDQADGMGPKPIYDPIGPASPLPAAPNPIESLGGLVQKVIEQLAKIQEHTAALAASVVPVKAEPSPAVPAVEEIP